MKKNLIIRFKNTDNNLKFFLLKARDEKRYNLKDVGILIDQKLQIVLRNKSMLLIIIQMRYCI
jgi:hypothetical protein